MIPRTRASTHIWGRPNFSAWPLWALAWAEFQATQGRSRMRDGVHDRGRGNVPRWFVVCELGEGECHCPRCFGETGSLTASYNRWRRINRALLDEIDADPPAVAARSAAQPASPAAGGLASTIAALRARLLEDP